MTTTEARETPAQHLATSSALLILRVAAGSMMMVHGWAKASAWAEMSADFPDPLGVGSATSLALAIFGELVASALLLPGLLTRLAAVPYVVTMFVAGVVVHSGDPWERKELAVLYLIVGVVIAIAGPGRFSVDALLAGRSPRARWLV